MDQHKLRSLVFDKTGVRIDVDDPIFALVALNEAVLAETVGRQVALLEAATAALLAQAGVPGAERPAAPATGFTAPAAASFTAPPVVAGKPIATVSPKLSRREWRLLGAAAGIAVGSALLVLAGQALWFKPPPPAPAPVIQARELTAAQQAALREGEKLARAVQKLDPRARALIQSEMQKP